jgi:hypothetical protein
MVGPVQGPVVTGFISRLREQRPGEAYGQLFGRGAGSVAIARGGQPRECALSDPSESGVADPLVVQQLRNGDQHHHDRCAAEKHQARPWPDNSGAGNR